MQISFSRAINMTSPIDSPRAISCPTAELYLFVISIVDEPGTLLQALSVFASYGINIVSIYSSSTDYTKKREAAEVNIIADLTGKKVSAEQIAKSLKLLTVVKDVKVYGKQLPDMIVDEAHYPLMLLGEHAIIYRESAIKALIMGLRSQLGAAAEVLLYHIGFNIGRGIWSTLKSKASEDLKLFTEYVKYLMFIHSVSKVMEITINIDEKKAVVKVEENYECAIAKNHGKPFSSLNRGIFAGLFSELLTTDKSVETKCIAAGDPYCEFVIGGV